MSGFVAMDRDALDHPVIGEAERFRAWFWLVSNAAWKPTKARISGKIVTLERGQFSFSVRFMAQSWGWSKSRVDRFINELRHEGMIATRSKTGTVAGQQAGQGQLVITICNYDKYQDPLTRKRDSHGSDSGTKLGQQRDKEEQGNKGTSNITPLKSPRSVCEKPDGVSDQHWSDWKLVRKRPVTKTVLTRIENEAAKIGWTLAQAIAESAESGWQGFKADWVKKNAAENERNGSDGYGKQSDKRDGIAKALDRRLGFDGSTGSPERRTVRPSEGDSSRPLARIANR